MLRTHLIILWILVVLVFCPAEVSSQAGSAQVPRELTLQQAEMLLLDRNLTVLAAKYQVDASRAARLIASYKLNPTVTLGAEQIPFYSPIPGSYPRFLTTNADAGANPVYTFRFDKILERGGKRELRTAAADEQLQATEAQMLDAIRTQLFQLRRAFGNAILARENQKIAETVAQQYAQTERLTLAKADQGDIARVEVYRAGAGRLQYQQALLQARTAYDSASRDVLNLLGARSQDVASVGSGPADASLELLGDFETRTVAKSLDELHSIALVRRPDVIAARHLSASADRSTQLARAQRNKDWDVGFEYQRVGSDHTAGVVVSVPLFIHNDQRALATQAEATQRSAESQLKQAEIQAATDVDKAYQSYLSARQVLDLYTTENMSQVERLRTVANASFEQGGSSLFEVLDAQRAYSGAMNSYNQAKADYQIALWELEQAVGGPLD